MKVHSVHDARFSPYGKIVEGYDFSQLIDRMNQLSLPSQGIVYVASDPQLEQLPVFQAFQDGFFGGMPTALGYCMGFNDALNGLEYHKGSEVNVSATDYIVMIGRLQDLEPGFRYDSSRIEAFYIPAGIGVEFYSTTLHYCACNLDEKGYRHATFLPRGTNTPIPSGFVRRTGEDTLLLQVNKWMIAHPEGNQDPAVPCTIYGPNWTIRDLDWSEIQKSKRKDHLI